QVSLVEFEDVDNFELAAAGRKLLAVRRPGQPVKSLVDGDSRNDLRLRFIQVDDDDFVLAVAGMEDGGELTGGVDGNVDGEVAEVEVFAGGFELPLVGKLHKAALVQAGKHALRARRLREYHNRAEKQDCHGQRRMGTHRIPSRKLRD